MKIGLHSDLHTEHSLCQIGNLDELDVLVLAGDIGNLQTIEILFEEILNQRLDLPILYVLGNHEYYEMYFHEVDSKYRAVCEKYGIELLNNQHIQIGDVLFAGTTLWTNFFLALNQVESMTWAKQGINDFYEIFHAIEGALPELFTPEDMLNEFQKAYHYVLQTLTSTEFTGLKKVVVSHFLPARQLIPPEYIDTHEKVIHAAYWANDLPELYSLTNYWFYGHSHTNIEMTLDKTRFHCNQRGYSKVFNAVEPGNGYRHGYVIEL